MLIKSAILSTFCVFLFISCNDENKENEAGKHTIVEDHPVTLGNDEPMNNATDSTSSSYWVEAVKNEDQNGWGYIIYQGNKAYIKQPHIPAISGIKPFKNEEDAYRTGNFAVLKIEQGVMPPTITKEELDSLGVLY